MELKLGKMTMRELSEWFGLKPDSISKSAPHARENKFKQLELYADYHWEGKKLIIDKIKQPTYNKAFDLVEKEFPKRWGMVKDKTNHYNESQFKKRIDTCTRVGKDIYYNVPEISSQISESTAITYTCKTKIKKYGHNHLDDHGTDGYCEYVWMNKDGTDELPEEQQKILEQCKVDAYKDYTSLIVDIDDDYHKGLISKEERDKYVGEIDTNTNYNIFIGLVIDKLGFLPDKRTRLIDCKYFD